MRPPPDNRLSRDMLVGYFLGGAAPRDLWQVGMELEKLGRDARDGRPIPYEADGPCVRAALEFFLDRRGGEPILEAGRIIGIHAPWGTITLEPAGQLEWSSRPHRCLLELEQALEEHLAVLRDAASALGIVWLDLGVDPDFPVEEMPWMPKARYAIMRDYFRRKGRLAHRMMTQTASIQCAFDYADPRDWKRKFRAAADLTPVATALFANSERIDGRPSGYRSFRHVIWRQTDDDRCGLPWIVFDDGFGIERWVDWILDVPMLFRRKGDGLVPPDGSTFRDLLEGPRGAEVELEDWATHCSSIFTDVRCYTYMEVRSADLQPDDRAFAVPAFWTGILYDDDAIDAVIDACHDLDYAGWRRAMDSAARHGLDGTVGRWSVRELAQRAVGYAVRAIERGVPCAGDGSSVRYLERLASFVNLDVKV